MFLSDLISFQAEEKRSCAKADGCGCWHARYDVAVDVRVRREEVESGGHFAKGFERRKKFLCKCVCMQK